MSRTTSIDVNCPRCHNSFKARVYTEIDAVIDPDLADEAADGGALFLCECPHCHFAENLGVPCLYVDFEHNVFVYNMPAGGDVSSALALIEIRRSRLPVSGKPTTRLAFSLDEFVEEVAIMRFGLDDRAVEYVKRELEKRFSEANPEAEVASMRFSKLESDGLVFLAYARDGSVYTGRFSLRDYLDVELRLGSEGYFQGDPPHVSRGWLSTMENFLAQSKTPDSDEELYHEHEEELPDTD